MLDPNDQFTPDQYELMLNTKHEQDQLKKERALMRKNAEKIDDFEDGRRKSFMGSCCMNMCYFGLTLTLGMMFAGFFSDVYLKYKLELKEAKA